MIDKHHKTRHSVLIDLSEVAELLRGMLLDTGLITYPIYEQIKDSKNRLKYLADVIDVKLMQYARWGFTEYGDNSDALNDCTRTYLRNEFGEGIANTPWELAALDFMSEFDLAIIELMPPEVCAYTWHVWTSTLVGNTLIIADQGDYRIITYFNRDDDTIAKLKRRYSKEVLYQHE